MKNAKPISLISSNILYMQQPLPQKPYFSTDHVFKTPETKLLEHSLIETVNLLACLYVTSFPNILYSSITGKDKFEMVTVVIA